MKNATVEFDRELILRYNKPGPRYTSYPPAPQFQPSFGAREFTGAVVANNSRSRRDLSLYVHIPFCDSLCYFCGCNMMVSHNYQKAKDYVTVLKKEIDLLRTMIGTERKIAQLHWGGGTPTFLNPPEIRDLSSHVNSLFPSIESAERGVEIDPRGLTFDHLQALKEAGFNRASMGVQDFDDRVQRAVNRIQPEKMTREVLGWLRELGYSSINIDLIYGLPFQTVESFTKTVDKIVDINPDRIALFNFAFVPWMKKHQTVIKPEMLPSPDEKLLILERSIAKFTVAGYVYIGMDHFAKPDDELYVAQQKKLLYRNFQGYSTHADCDLYAFGISSISQFDDIYAQNYREIPEWREHIEKGEPATFQGYRLTRDDLIRRHVIMRMMCDFELDTKDVGRRFDLVFGDYFSDALKQMEGFEKDGLVMAGNGILRVTPKGRLLIRNIVMAFDAYLSTSPAGEKRFSRTV